MRRDKFFILCPVLVETDDGEVCSVTMPTHEAALRAIAATGGDHTRFSEQTALEELKRLADNDRVLRTKIKH